MASPARTSAQLPSGVPHSASAATHDARSPSLTSPSNTIVSGGAPTAVSRPSGRRTTFTSAVASGTGCNGTSPKPMQSSTSPCCASSKMTVAERSSRSVVGVPEELQAPPAVRHPRVSPSARARPLNVSSTGAPTRARSGCGDEVTAVAVRVSSS